MKFVVDQPISPLVAEWLQGEGHDAFHLRDRGMSRLEDNAIFQLAVNESRIIITADLDYARIIALSGLAGPGLILFRAGNITNDEMLELLTRVLARVAPERLKASVVVVDQSTIRIAALPIRPDLRAQSADSLV